MNCSPEYPARGNIRQLMRGIVSGWALAVCCATVGDVAVGASTADWTAVEMVAAVSNKLRLPTIDAFFGPSTNRWGRILMSNCVVLLTSLGQPSMYQQRTNTARHACRLTYLPAFSSPLVLDAQETLRGPALTLIAWGYTDYPYDTQPPFRTTIPIPAKRWKRFAELLITSGFWDQPSHREESEGFDGDRWVLEVLQGGRYHLVDRWGTDDPKHEALCEELAQWAPLKRDKYGFLALRDGLAEQLRRRAPRKLEWVYGLPKNKQCPSCGGSLRGCMGAYGLIPEDPEAYYWIYYCPQRHLWLLSAERGFFRPDSVEVQQAMQKRFDAWWAQYGRKFK